MPKITVVSREGEERVIEANVGDSLMETIRDSNFGDLQAMCGGCCSCATCHVYVDEAFGELLRPMNEDENDLLDTSSYRRENSRLSCQIGITDELNGLRAEIAPED
jgi:2Fe-2S ferredoxin